MKLYTVQIPIEIEVTAPDPETARKLGVAKAMGILPKLLETGEVKVVPENAYIPVSIEKLSKEFIRKLQRLIRSFGRRVSADELKFPAEVKEAYIIGNDLVVAWDSSFLYFGKIQRGGEK